ncbi:MAG: GntR family transcriptional regulator [Lentisphaerae bacterium]|nr:GntR family transcriptional regulator [Lentisphaerota bacterium]
MSDLLAYYKLEKELRMQIISGFLPDYHRIHSENILAARYGICRNSVRKALNNLEKEGLIFRKKGSGTFVVPANERKNDFQLAPKSGNIILYLSFSSLYSRSTFQESSTFKVMYDGISKILTPAGYGFRAAHVGINWQAPEELNDPAVGGVIFEGVVPKEFFDRYLSKKPAIGVNCYNPELECSWVLEDSRQVGELSVKHLYSLGYRKIAILSDEASSPPMQEKLSGYYSGIHKVGLPLKEKFVIYWERAKINGELCNEGIAGSSFKPCLKELFTSDDHPDAVIVQDSYRAEQTRLALESFGLSVPEDVAIICSTGRSQYRRTKILYEGFCARKHEVFAEAAKEIIEEIENRTAVSNRITYMRPFLTKGDSVRDKNIHQQTKGDFEL